jgi:hypothetical protein
LKYPNPLLFIIIFIKSKYCKQVNIPFQNFTSQQFALTAEPGGPRYSTLTISPLNSRHPKHNYFIALFLPSRSPGFLPLSLPPGHPGAVDLLGVFL